MNCCHLSCQKAENNGKKEKETPKDCAAKCQGCALSLRIYRGHRRTRAGDKGYENQEVL